MVAGQCCAARSQEQRRALGIRLTARPSRPAAPSPRRIGGRENYFHCKTCASCYSVNLRVGGRAGGQAGGWVGGWVGGRAGWWLGGRVGGWAGGQGEYSGIGTWP